MAAAELDLVVKARNEAQGALKSLRRDLRALRVFNPFTALNRAAAGFFRMIGRGLRLLTSFRSILAGIGITLSAGFLGAQVAREFSGFERAIAEVSTLLPEVQGQTEALTRSVKDLSMAYGQAPVDTAKALYNAISAGFTDIDEATRVLDVANKLAVGGATDVNSAFEGLLATLKPYGAGADEAAAFSDKLFATVRAGVTTIPELSNSLAMVAPAAAEAGVSVDELLAGIASITSTTKASTSQAATQIRSLSAAVIAAAEGTKRVQQRFGVDLSNVFSVSRVEAVGLQQVLQDVRAELQGLSSDDQKAAIQALVGSQEALLGFFTLSGAGAESFRSSFEGIQNAAGATEEAFKKMSRTIGLQFDRLKSAVSVLFVNIGELVGPAVSRVIANVREAVELVGRYIETLKADFQEAFEGIGDFDAQDLAARIIFVGNVAVAAVRDVSNEFSNLRGTVGPVMEFIGNSVAFFLEMLDRGQSGAAVMFSAVLAFWTDFKAVVGQGLNDLFNLAITGWRKAKQIILAGLSEILGMMQDILDRSVSVAQFFGASGVAIRNTSIALGGARREINRTVEEVKKAPKVEFFDVEGLREEAAEALGALDDSMAQAAQGGALAKTADAIRAVVSGSIEGAAPRTAAALQSFDQIKAKLAELGVEAKETADEVARIFNKGEKKGGGGISGSSTIGGSVGDTSSNKLTPKGGGGGGLFSDALGGMGAGLTEFKENALNTFTVAKDASMQFASALSDGVANAFVSVIDGTKDLGSAIKDLGKEFVVMLIRTAAQMIANIAVAIALGAAMAFATGGASAAAGTTAAQSALAAIGPMIAAANTINANKATPMARGGIVTGPTSALVGEAGAEAVLPLDAPQGRRALARAVNDAGGGDGQQAVNVNFNITAMDGASVQSVLAKQRGTITTIIAEAMRQNQTLRTSTREASRG